MRTKFTLAVIAATFAAVAPSGSLFIAKAETYNHEFVLEDGSAILCSVITTGQFSTSTRCIRVSKEARYKASVKYVEGLTTLNECADLASAAQKMNPEISDYSGSVLSACLGRDAFSKRRPSAPGYAYLINCKGELTDKPVNLLLTPKRSLSKCPGLVELALSGKVPYRTDQAQ